MTVTRDPGGRPGPGEPEAAGSAGGQPAGAQPPENGTQPPGAAAPPGDQPGGAQAAEQPDAGPAAPVTSDGTEVIDAVTSAGALVPVAAVATAAPSSALAPRTTVVTKQPEVAVSWPGPGDGGGQRKQPQGLELADAIGPIAGGALAVLAVLLLALVANLLFLSGIEEGTAQVAAFDSLRGQLATGTAPVTPYAPSGKAGSLLPLGTPMAILDIPEIGVRNAVVLNGTAGSVLMQGPGLQQDTVLPGQAGVSVIMGRAWSYSGPFGHLTGLRPGDQIKAVTGQGTATYTVTDVRVAGDPDTPLPAGEGRLTLETALGSSFIPSGVLRIDAQLTSAVQPTPALPDLGALPGPQRPMGDDPSALLPLLLWLLALTAVVTGAVLAWQRWGRWQAWLVFGPLALMVGLFAADQVTRLLPNLM